MPGSNLVGRQLGPYYIEGIVGGGSLAVVYRAITPDDEVVALKIFIAPMGIDQEETLLTRFQLEAKTASRLKHPHIVSVLDAGQIDDFVYMVMPLIKGMTLTEHLKKRPKVSESVACDICGQIATALGYAYDQGVVHRDVKPSNILITPDGHAMLNDFGVARALDNPILTQAGHLIGTPAYMAPEQAMQKNIDGRSDIYSLGVVLYQMTTGRLPFRGTIPEMLHAHVYETPPPPSSVANLSPQMEKIILKAMSKNNNHRFADGWQMAEALNKLNDGSVQYSPPNESWLTTLKRWFLAH